MSGAPAEHALMGPVPVPPPPPPPRAREACGGGRDSAAGRWPFLAAPGHRPLGWRAPRLPRARGVDVPHGLSQAQLRSLLEGQGVRVEDITTEYDHDLEAAPARSRVCVVLFGSRVCVVLFGYSPSPRKLTLQYTEGEAVTNPLRPPLGLQAGAAQRQARHIRRYCTKGRWRCSCAAATTKAGLNPPSRRWNRGPRQGPRRRRGHLRRQGALPRPGMEGWGRRRTRSA